MQHLWISGLYRVSESSWNKNIVWARKDKESPVKPHDILYIPTCHRPPKNQPARSQIILFTVMQPLFSRWTGFLMLQDINDLLKWDKEIHGYWCNTATQQGWRAQQSLDIFSLPKLFQMLLGVDNSNSCFWQGHLKICELLQDCAKISVTAFQFKNSWLAPGFISPGLSP